MNLFRWLRSRRLRKAREKYAYWKGRREAVESLGKANCHLRFPAYQEICGQLARYEERVEHLMRE